MVEICVKSSVEGSVDLRESQKWRWLKFGESKLFFSKMAQPVKCTLGQLSYVQVILFLGVYSDLHIL